MPSKTIKIRICKTCRYYESVSEMSGYCYYNPPQVETTIYPEHPDGSGCGEYKAHNNIYPYVDAGHYCGKWEDKDYA